MATEAIVMMKPTARDNHNTLYAHELVEAALKASEGEFGDYKLSVVFSSGNSERTKRMLLLKGEADLTFAPTTAHWEQAFIPIRIPIFKGLLGKRVLIIPKADQHLYSKITSLDELRQYRLGSLNIWQITDIFRQNGFTVVEGSALWGMYHMLHRGRFDFLPRGAYEVEKEIDYINKEISGLTIEKSILLNVQFASYFFVKIDKPKLAKRLRAGLLSIIKNGQFDQIFNRYFGDTMKNLHLSERKNFEIVNESLSELSINNIRTFWPAQAALTN